MIETPISINTNIDLIGIERIISSIGNLIIAPPIRDIKRCPAIMLAVRRNVKANGRIKFLSTSTITINLIKKIGVPTGIRCERKFVNDLIQINLITDTQKT